MSAPIRTNDNSFERVTKLLPADVTAAFLSAKAGLVSFIGNPEAAGPIFWTFLTILALCPFYFWYVNKIRNAYQIAFMCMSFIIFSISIANIQFMAFFDGFQNAINIISIVLPILWAFLLSRIFVEALGSKMEEAA